MTLRKYYIGSLGPFLYDDTDAIDDPDGDFSGEDQASMTTNGPVRSTYEAAHDDDYVRLADILKSIGLNQNADPLIDPNTTLYTFIMTKHANCPAGAVDFWHIRTQWYSEISLTASRAQIALKFNGANEAHIRNRNSGVWSAWDKITPETAAELLVKIKTVDGTGSGLDADLLDGQEGVYYAKQSDMTTAENDIDTLETWKATGVSGSFTTVDGKTVTVTNGLITAIV